MRSPDPPASVRLFLALWPTPALRDSLDAHAAAWSWDDRARRTRTERLHITLHFLGDVPDSRLPDLRQGLAVPWQGCELLLDRPTVWPGGIAVLEATEVPARLAKLHAALRERLQALQVPVESRRYRPHVTLARKAFGSHPPADFPPLRWPAGPGYDLVRSLPGGRGYETVQRFG
jgi:RNA 2',3'-cyclic 3'-phosphodiesterase